MSDYQDEVPHYNSAEAKDLPALTRDARGHANEAENALQRTMSRLDKIEELTEGLVCPETGDIPCECPTPTPTPSPPVDLHNGPLPDIITDWAATERGSEETYYFNKGIAPSAAPDVVGAFRMVVPFSHMSYDDFVVFPGQPGAAHLHGHYGNSEADAFSTYESLRTTGESNAMNVLNRSAYITPMILNGLGEVVLPDHMITYYKGRPQNDPVNAERGIISGPTIPNGMRALAGESMDPAIPTVGARLTCSGSGQKFKDLPEMLAAVDRSLITWIAAEVSFPSLWNGLDLDSPDHRSHLKDLVWNGNSGQWEIPDPAFNHLMATITVRPFWSIHPEDNLANFAFSSDEMAGKAPLGSMHADMLLAWDPTARAKVEDHAIGELLNCSGGDFGDGTAMAHDFGSSPTASPRIVPVPENVYAGMHNH